MKIHLIDGTYELFRNYYGIPARLRDGPGRAARGVVRGIVAMLGEGVTHVGVATDHVIESFRNDLWPGYKTGAGVPEPLRAQFGLLEEALEAIGVRVFPMVDLEADDALAALARQAAADPRVEQVRILTPDKDLAQCVRGDRVVQVIRRDGTVVDEAGVVARYGVPPASIPDWLALVGDSADGYPGLPGWGARSSAAVLRRHGHLEGIPDREREWDVEVRGAARLAAALREGMEAALLFRNLATLRDEADLVGSVDDLRWRGPADPAAVAAVEERLGWREGQAGS